MKANSEQIVLDFFRQYCTEEWLPLIQHHTVLSEVKKNETFIQQGEPVTGMYLLVSGKAKVISHFYGKKEHIFRLANAVSLIGHRSLLSEKFSISAVALVPGTVAFIPLNLFVKLYKTNPAFNLFLLEFFTRELNESEEQQYMLTIDNVRQRVAYCLLKLLSIFGYDQTVSGKLEYTLSRRDISIICNTTYESVIRTLSVFEKEQVIGSEGKSVIIRDEERLRGIALGTIEIKPN